MSAAAFALLVVHFVQPAVLLEFGGRCFPVLLHPGDHAQQQKRRLVSCVCVCVCAQKVAKTIRPTRQDSIACLSVVVE